MAEHAKQWMSSDSDAAKTSRWSTEANGAVPREAWYYGPRLGRTAVSPEFLGALRLVFWEGADAKLDESLTISGVPLLRVTLPKRLVPSFEADDTTFYLYKAVAPGVVVDFGRLWGGTVAEPVRRAAPMTMMGDVSLAVDPTDMPAPRGVLRSDLARAEAGRLGPITTEVEMIPERPPLQIARVRGGPDQRQEPHVYEGVKPAGPTCVPEFDAESAPSNPRAVTAANKLFGANDDEDDGPVPLRPLAVPQARRETPPETDPDNQFPVTPGPIVDTRFAVTMVVIIAFSIGFFYGLLEYLLSLS